MACVRNAFAKRHGGTPHVDACQLSNTQTQQGNAAAQAASTKTCTLMLRPKRSLESRVWVLRRCGLLKADTANLARRGSAASSRSSIAHTPVSHVARRNDATS